MRTAKPLLTCSRIAEFGPSATSGVISTPRLIGPGASSSTSRFASLSRLAVHPEQMRVLADRREQPGALPLELHAQQIQHVAARQDVVEACATSTPSAVTPGGHERRRAADDHLRAELDEAVDIAASHPAMRDVADEADRQPRDAAAPLADREDVEQPLRRMFVRAVAGIDDGGLEMPGQQMRRAGRAMAHDDDIDAHRLDVLGRVDERLALAQARSAGREVDGVGPEPPGREAETRSRARGRLEEEIGDDVAFQVIALGIAAFADADEFLGAIENSRDLIGCEIFEAEKIGQ